MPTYAMSKIANTMFAQELQRRLDAEGSSIISISVDPGGVSTDGALAIFVPVMRPMVKKTMNTPEQGAITPLFAATAAEVREKRGEYGGKFLQPFGQIGKPHPILGHEGAVGALWSRTEEEVGKYLQKNGLAPLEPW
jgi:NAD(P)-dependent dehydrogenase (short-subunit alcohol dehydrogenase family)